jgi:hypothetical protein
LFSAFIFRFLVDSSTIGAENNAPAGMGRSPMKAGGIIKLRRGFLTKVSSEVTIFLKLPFSRRRLLRKMARIIIANNSKVTGLITARIMFFNRARGLIPKIIPIITEIEKMIIPKFHFPFNYSLAPIVFQFASTIRTKGNLLLVEITAIRTYIRPPC